MKTDGRAEPETGEAHTSVKGTWAYRAKSLYAVAMRRAGRTLAALGPFPGEVPHRDRRLKHWMVSLTKIHDAVEIAKLGVPWWTYRAIDVVDAWLAARPQPIRVFEYGSGASTLWLADRADAVVSVEHHQGFATVMAGVLADRKNVEFHVVGPKASKHPAIGSHKPGHSSMDFTDYVGTIDKVGGVFDLIVIDGRAREACLRASVGHLSPGGLIVYDNSKRKRYARAIAASKLNERRFRGLTPTLPYPDQTSVLSVDPLSGVRDRRS